MEEARIIQAGTIVYPDHSGAHQQDFVQHANGISRTIPAGFHASTPHLLKTYIEMTEKNQINLPPELQGKKFRIRKLTPKECFRLMGVDDADTDMLMNAERNGKRVLSNSALYKLAGNSIVVDVLYHIMRTLFIDKEQPMEPGTQLTLF